MNDFIIWLYILGGLGGICLIVLSIQAMLAQIKTCQILEEIVNSGAIPKVLEMRTKKVEEDKISTG